VDTGEKNFIPPELLPLVDNHTLYREAWYYRNQKGYENLSFTESEVVDILREGHYELYCDDSLFKVSSFEDMRRVEQVALIIIRKYIDRFYKREQQEWEYRQLEYEAFDSGDNNIP